jgi:hypothetical protein
MVFHRSLLSVFVLAGQFDYSTKEYLLFILFSELNERVIPTPGKNPCNERTARESAGTTRQCLSWKFRVMSQLESRPTHIPFVAMGACA